MLIASQQKNLVSGFILEAGSKVFLMPQIVQFSIANPATFPKSR